MLIGEFRVGYAHTKTLNLYETLNWNIMKKILVSISLVCLSMLAIAQFPFKTGSVEIDADLNRINTEAKLDFGAFKSELSVSFNIEAKRIGLITCLIDDENSMGIPELKKVLIENLKIMPEIIMA